MTKTKADIVAELRREGVNINSEEGKKKLVEALEREELKDKNKKDEG